MSISLGFIILFLCFSCTKYKFLVELQLPTSNTLPKTKTQTTPTLGESIVSSQTLHDILASSTNKYINLSLLFFSSLSWSLHWTGSHSPHISIGNVKNSFLLLNANDNKSYEDQKGIFTVLSFASSCITTFPLFRVWCVKILNFVHPCSPHFLIFQSPNWIEFNFYSVLNSLTVLSSRQI